jgi:uncharacterized alkaline shock family protein YloU
MEGQATISAEILASYAADAAREVPGVRGLAESTLQHRHRGVQVTTDDGRVAIEIHLEVEWGASVPELGRAVQRKVREYLARMTDVDLASVDVVVDEIGPVP